MESASAERFAPLFQRLAPALFAQALAILADRAAAEDVVQEAFVRVWRRRERLHDLDRLDGYLFSAVRNLALDQQRRGLRAETASRHLVRATTSGPTNGPDAERIDAALCQLPAQQREVVVLRVYQGLSFAEVARRVGAPLGTVHSRYRYAMTRLRERLQPLQPACEDPHE